MKVDLNVHLRGLKTDDVGPIETILRANEGVFSDQEVRAAVEMVASALTDTSLSSGTDGYRFLVAENEGRVGGYALYAKTPLTQATWDLYWIATDPRHHGRGAGRALLRAVEDAVRREGGKLVVIETSSRPEYAKARRFYEAAGYTRQAQFPDFYRDGDDKIVYVRRLDRG